MKHTVLKVALITLMLTVPGVLGAQQRDSQHVSFVKIADNLYQVTGGRGANGGAFISEDGVLLIDTKMDEASMKELFRELGEITGRPLRFLVNTHSDGDHVRGNRYVPADVTIISHENCRSEFFHTLRDGSESEWNDPSLARFIPSVTYSDRMSLHMGGKSIELWHFGVGHTTGDTVVFFPDEKVAFIGDQYFEGRPPLIHSYKGGSALGHIANLETMLDTIDAKTFLSGHAEPVSRDDISRLIREMKERVEKVESRIIQGENLEEIRKRFDENEADLVGTIYNEVRARL